MSSTIRDVARKAGVALGTVSRYLNGHSLREENRIRIQKAIEELGFKENLIAKGLKNNRSMTIGVVIGNLTDIFSTSIVTAIERVAEKENYSIILCDYEGLSVKQEQKLRFLKDRSVDGLILFPEGSYLSVLEEYAHAKIPVVIVNDDVPDFLTDKVTVDNASASFRAVEKFIHLHHKKIAIINGSKNTYVARERFRGYLEALQVYDIIPEERYIKYGNFSNTGGYMAVKELMEDTDPPTAIYVTNYYMTLGAVMAIHEMGIKVPDQLSVIGFDHFELSDVIKPALTVIEQPTQKMGEVAAELLLKRIRGDYENFPVQHQMNTRMLVRDSVRDLQQ